MWSFPQGTPRWTYTFSPELFDGPSHKWTANFRSHSSEVECESEYLSGWPLGISKNAAWRKREEWSNFEEQWEREGWKKRIEEAALGHQRRNCFLPACGFSFCWGRSGWMDRVSELCCGPKRSMISLPCSLNEKHSGLDWWSSTAFHQDRNKTKTKTNQNK